MKSFFIFIFLCCSWWTTALGGELEYKTDKVLTDPDKILEFEVADMNSDGKPDLITHHASGAVKIHLAVEPAPPPKPKLLLSEDFEKLGSNAATNKVYMGGQGRGNSTGMVFDQGPGHDLIQLDYNFAREDFTLSLWVRFELGFGKEEHANTVFTLGAKDYSALVLMRAPSSAGGRLIFSASYEGKSWDLSLKSPKSINNGDWTHVVIVRKSLDVMLYLNGILVDRALAGSTLKVDSGQLRLGNYFEDGKDRALIGTLDDIQIFGEALTQDQITGL